VYCLRWRNKSLLFTSHIIVKHFNYHILYIINPDYSNEICDVFGWNITRSGSTNFYQISSIHPCCTNHRPYYMPTRVCTKRLSITLMQWRSKYVKIEIFWNISIIQNMLKILMKSKEHEVNNTITALLVLSPS